MLQLLRKRLHPHSKINFLEVLSVVILETFHFFTLRAVTTKADSCGRADYDVGMRSHVCWDCGSESRRRHESLSLVNIVLLGRRLCDEPITRLGESYRVSVCVSLSVIKANSNSLHVK